MESLDVETWKDQTLHFLQSLEVWQFAVAGAVLLALLLLLFFRNSGKKRKARQVAPRLELHAFQVSPLGRDAFLKIRNRGETATISNLQIKGRNDISVKNAYAGHQLDREGVYGLLLEAGGKKKIGNNFSVELTYLDQLGNAYRQTFQMSTQRARTPRLIRYA